MSTPEPQTHSHEIVKLIIAHDVLMWAGAILAIIGVAFLLTRKAYEMLNIEDAIMGLLCTLAMVGALFGRNPTQVLGITDAGTVALTAEILALLLVALLLRVRVGAAWLPLGIPA